MRGLHLFLPAILLALFSPLPTALSEEIDLDRALVRQSKYTTPTNKLSFAETARATNLSTLSYQAWRAERKLAGIETKDGLIHTAALNIKPQAFYRFEKLTPWRLFASGTYSDDLEPKNEFEGVKSIKHWGFHGGIMRQIEDLAATFGMGGRFTKSESNLFETTVKAFEMEVGYSNKEIVEYIIPFVPLGKKNHMDLGVRASYMPLAWLESRTPENPREISTRTTGFQYQASLNYFFGRDLAIGVGYRKSDISGRGRVPDEKASGWYLELSFVR